MSWCPKCGSGSIDGPLYTENAYGKEVLIYTCMQCGYTKATPTLDAQQPVADGEALK